MSLAGNVPARWAPSAAQLAARMDQEGPETVYKDEEEPTLATYAATMAGLAVGALTHRAELRAKGSRSRAPPLALHTDTAKYTGTDTDTGIGIGMGMGMGMGTMVTTTTITWGLCRGTPQELPTQTR